MISYLFIMIITHFSENFKRYRLCGDEIDNPLYRCYTQNKGEGLI